MTKKSNTADWTVAKVKTFMGREGHGFNCELRYKGDPVCFIINSADGGDFRWQWCQAMSDVKTRLAVLVKALPKWVDKCTGPEGITQNEDMWLEGLVNDQANAAQLKKWCKTSVVFTLDGDAEGAYRKCTFKTAEEYRKTVAHIRTKYHDRTVTILNENYQ